MSEVVDFIIVGGGISGRLMQLELQKSGVSTLVYDELEGNECSVVAAGLANPLVGKFFTIGWRANEFFANLSDYYNDLEKRLESTFYRPCKMRRIISTAGEQNIWLSKAHLAKYNGFCDFSNDNIEGLNTQFGLLNVYQGGELNASAFLEACISLPTKSEVFEHNKIDFAKKEYIGIGFKHIIFCEGYKVNENPFFKKLVDVIPTKGELLEIETDLEPNGDVYLGPVFLQHLAGKKWRVGSTYQQREASTHPTEMMKEDLISKVDKVLKLPYKVLNHYCGIRPASEDRKPILGTHPDHRNIHIVNGMGSKAVSLAPLLVKEMSDYVINNTPLYPEIDIQRFW